MLDGFVWSVDERVGGHGAQFCGHLTVGWCEIFALRSNPLGYSAQGIAILGEARAVPLVIPRASFARQLIGSMPAFLESFISRKTNRAMVITNAEEDIRIPFKHVGNVRKDREITRRRNTPM